MPRFIRACKRQDVDKTPVWFMRQAGRYLPGYRKLRENYSLFELIRNPRLAAKVVEEPVHAFGFDAAIIFADIVLPLTTMGAEVSLKEKVGPVFSKPVRSRVDVDRLVSGEPSKQLGFVYQQIGILKQSLPRVPLIGFSGAPFTLAAYLVEGGYSRNFESAKSFMYGNTEAWRKLMKMLTESIIDYVRAQVKAGVDAVQLFDSWVGSLSPADYSEFVEEYVSQILAEIDGVPRIYFGTCTAGLLDRFSKLEADVISVDWRVTISEAWRRLGHDKAIQGNLDPSALLGGKQISLRRSKEILDDADGRPGHIFGLGHGVLPETDPAVVGEVVDFVHHYELR
jgi:uroporphyrinogen decarboxylase